MSSTLEISIGPDGEKVLNGTLSLLCELGRGNQGKVKLAEGRDGLCAVKIKRRSRSGDDQEATVWQT